MGPAPLIGNKMAAAQIGSAFSRINQNHGRYDTSARSYPPETAVST